MDMFTYGPSSGAQVHVQRGNLPNNMVSPFLGIPGYKCKRVCAICHHIWSDEVILIVAGPGNSSM